MGPHMIREWLCPDSAASLKVLIAWGGSCSATLIAGRRDEVRERVQKLHHKTCYFGWADRSDFRSELVNTRTIQKSNFGTLLIQPPHPTYIYNLARIFLCTKSVLLFETSKNIIAGGSQPFELGIFSLLQLLEMLIGFEFWSRLQIFLSNGCYAKYPKSFYYYKWCCTEI